MSNLFSSRNVRIKHGLFDECLLPSECFSMLHLLCIPYPPPHLRKASPLINPRLEALEFHKPLLPPSFHNIVFDRKTKQDKKI